MSTPAAPSDLPTRSIELQSGRASYVDEGSGEPELLLVHGLPGSARDFRWLVPCLEPLRRIRLEMPGFGETPLATQPDPSVDARARFVVELSDALGLRRPILVGHSMGGIVSTRAITLAPDRFRGLVLISSPGLREHRGFRMFAAKRYSRLLRLPAVPFLIRPFMRMVFRRTGFLHATDEGMVHTVHCVAATSIPEHAAHLRRLSIPALHAFCADDPLVEAEIAAETASLLGGPMLRFADGKHNPQKHHAVEIGSALIEWARKL